MPEERVILLELELPLPAPEALALEVPGAAVGQ
jgi:hypothetical protein